MADINTTYVLEVGSRLEIGFRLAEGTALDVTYTPQGGSASLLASVTDSADSSDILPFVAFEQEGNGELKVVGKLMKKEASIDVAIFGSPSVGARIKWLARSVTGDGGPSAGAPQIETLTASIRIVKPRRP